MPTRPCQVELSLSSTEPSWVIGSSMPPSRHAFVAPIVASAARASHMASHGITKYIPPFTRPSPPCARPSVDVTVLSSRLGGQSREVSPGAMMPSPSAEVQHTACYNTQLNRPGQISNGWPSLLQHSTVSHATCNMPHAVHPTCGTEILLPAHYRGLIVFQKPCRSPSIHNDVSTFASANFKHFPITCSSEAFTDQTLVLPRQISRK